MNKIGILAYGSLINDPGEELKKYIIDKIPVITPFKVEFARKSIGRDEAPTLVPVEKGGTYVKAILLVLEEGVSEEEAKNMLYRREINKPGVLNKVYKEPLPGKKNSVYIIRDLEQDYSRHGIKTVFYTRIAPNIDPLNSKKLALLAIASAKTESGKNKRDGISYLIDAKSNNIETPLMKEYEEEICSQVSKEYKTKIKSLEEARQKLTII